MGMWKIFPSVRVMARILQIALARAIRPEVDGSAPSLALLPTQGAAYASRHV